MHEAIVEKLYNEYIANGFISEDKVFDVLQKEGLPLYGVEFVCEQLLARGVIILEEVSEKDDIDDEPFDQTQTDYKIVFSKIIEMDEGLHDLVDYMRNVKPPKRREWQNLLPQAQSGNRYARNRLFEMYMRVAAKIALHYAIRYDLSLADTIQDAFSGLIIAIDKFEYGKQDHFTTYFPFWIRQLILREEPVTNPTIYVPVHIKEKLFAIVDVKKSHICEKCEKYRICPNLIDEIKNVLNCNQKEALSLFDLLTPFYSLEDLVEIEYDNKKVGLISDNGQQVEEIIEKLETMNQQAFVNKKMELLTEKESLIIRLRYGINGTEPMTLEEIGKRLNVTRERIRQIEQRATRKLKVRMGQLK